MKKQSRQNRSEKINSITAPENHLLPEENRAESDRWWKLGVVVGIWACLLLASQLVADFTYNRWDNFEYFTTTPLAAHSQWLKGVIPFWNHYQLLGEPLLANGMPSALYFPYTVLLVLMRSLGLPDEQFPLLVILSHLPLMGVGWFLLMRFLGIRASLAWLGAISISSSGYMTTYSAVWIFVCPIFTWLPWILLGVLRLLLSQRSISGLFFMTFGLTAIGYVTHPQFIAYAWLFVLLFAVFISHFWLRRWRTLSRLILPALSAVLLSAPAILPVASLFPYTARTSSFSMEAFLHRPANLSALLGMLTPVFRIDNGFIIHNTSSVFYQGAWVIPALLTAWLVFRQRKQIVGKEKNSPRRKKALQETDPSQGLSATLKAASLVGLIFLLFSLGKSGGIYLLTHWIPIWSSFRWPLKFAPFALVAIGLAGTIALELYTRNGHEVSVKSRIQISSIVLIICFVFLALYGSETLLTVGGGLSFIGGLLMIPAVFWCDVRKVRRGLLLLGFMSVVGITALTHSLGMKMYTEEYGSVGPHELGIDNRYRVLPLSPHRWIPGQPSAMQQHGLFHSATANNYYSLTGHTTAMAPKWYLRYIASNLLGLIPRQNHNILLLSHFLRTLNVRYLIVAKDDKESIERVEGKQRYKKMKELERVFVYEDRGALPRVYFADRIKPFSESEFLKGLIENNQSLKTAFVEGVNGNQVWAEGKVKSSQWLDGGRVVLDIEAPRGGFLVISQTYFPQWKAFVDGKETPIFRVNGVVQGVEITQGASRVELVWKSTAFVLGCWLAAFGMILIIVVAYRRKYAPVTSGNS